MNTGYEYLLEFFDDYNYRLSKVGQERLDFARPDNITGHQQRSFNIWWAIEQCWKTGGIGLEIGSGGVHTPWCLSTDAYETENHPVYGGACHPYMKLSGEDLSIFSENSFSLILANHVIEHISGDITSILRHHWLRVLKSGAILAAILPDQTFVDVLSIDRDHKHAWTSTEFRYNIVESLLDIVDVIEFNTLTNNFSFNVVLRKK